MRFGLKMRSSVSIIDPCTRLIFIIHPTYGGAEGSLNLPPVAALLRSDSEGDMPLLFCRRQRETSAPEQHWVQLESTEEVASARIWKVVGCKRLFSHAEQRHKLPVSNAC